MKDKIIIRAEKIVKEFRLGALVVTALRGIDVEIKGGEFVAIMGPSGSGKSTLLHQLALLDDPTSGKIFIDGFDVSKLSDSGKTSFRLEKLGYVFQEYAILPELTALENVYLPALVRGMPKDKYLLKAREILAVVGLSQRENHLPSELSGGEQQRVAIARGMINDPKILFADEPCANLDSASSKHVLDQFISLNRARGQTIVMVTHEDWHKNYADRVIWVKDGLVERIETVRKR